MSIGSFIDEKLGLPVPKFIGCVGVPLGSLLVVLYYYSKNYSQNYIWGASKQVMVCNGVLQSTVFVFSAGAIRRFPCCD